MHDEQHTSPDHDGMRASRQRMTITQHALRFALGLVAAAAWVSVLGWAIGRVMTDRYWWSQWLWWIPTPIILAVCVIGLIAAIRPSNRAGRRRRRVIVWTLVLGAIAAWFIGIEHRFLHTTTTKPTHGVRLAHWNLSHPSSDEYEDYARAIDGIEADIWVMTSPSILPARAELLSRLDPASVVHRVGVFAVVTRFDILDEAPLVNRDGIWSYMLKLDTRAALGRAIVIYLVDLPTVPWTEPAKTFRTTRMTYAQRFARGLEGLPVPPPDVAVGDFNVPRGSASIDVMFPRLTHAFEQGGSGYGATFHRNIPYIHIDHVLVADWLRVPRYDILDPGLGRHDAQRAWLVAARPDGASSEASE